MLDMLEKRKQFQRGEAHRSVRTALLFLVKLRFRRFDLLKQHR